VSEHIWASNGDWLPMSCTVCRRPKFSMSDMRKVYDGTPCDGNDIEQTRDDLVSAEAALRNFETSARYARERVAHLRARLSDGLRP
jgi:hypothetical protein